MAVALEFIDFIVPISVIKKKYPGGWDQCLKDHERIIGGRVWYDDHLLRDGAMNPSDIQSLVEEWTELGFTPMEEINGEKIWKDCCVVESKFGGATLPCDWIEFSEIGQAAWLKGTIAGEVQSRRTIEKK